MTVAQSGKILGGLAVAVGLGWALMRPKGSGGVPRVQTPLSEEEALDIVDRAWKKVNGDEPSNRTLALVTAQSAFETGRFRNVRNGNMGNLIKGSADVPYVVISDRKWRAYPTPFDGAVDWLKLIKRRYPRAWASAIAGEPVLYVDALGAGGYFQEPDDPDYDATVSAYRHGVYDLMGDYLMILEGGGMPDKGVSARS